MFNYPVTVTICLLVMAGVSWLGRWLKRRDRERGLRWVLAWGSIAAWMFYGYWNLRPENFQWDNNLPLHMCDVASLAAPIVLLTRWRWLRASLYFWAFALTTQAFLTPRLQVGSDSIWYWLFWLNHSQILGIAIYDVAVGGYRPTFGDVWRAIGVTFIWLVVVFTLDVCFDWTYGFVGKRTGLSTASIIDELGDWPLRVLWMMLLSIAAYHVCWLPWFAVGWCKRITTRRSGRGGKSTSCSEPR